MPERTIYLFIQNDFFNKKHTYFDYLLIFIVRLRGCVSFFPHPGFSTPARFSHPKMICTRAQSTFSDNPQSTVRFSWNRTLFAFCHFWHVRETDKPTDDTDHHAMTVFAENSHDETDPTIIKICEDRTSLWVRLSQNFADFCPFWRAVSTLNCGTVTRFGWITIGSQISVVLWPVLHAIKRQETLTIRSLFFVVLDTGLVG